MTNREESGSRVKHGMTGFLALPRYLLPGRYIRRLSPQKRLWVNILAVCVIILFGTWALSSLLTADKAEAAWFNDNWAYRKAILFTHTAAETNVYLNLSGANALDTSTAGKFQSDCGDLRFTDASGKVLPYYLVSGCGTSTTVVHVFFSSMPAGDQYIYEYYGNPSIANGTKSADFTTAASGITFGSVGSEESTPGTLLEWKLDEGYGTTAKDSTANGNAGTLTNSPTWQDPTMCVSGKCLQFNGTNNYIVSTSNISCSYSRSVSVWFRGYSTGGPRTIFEDSACGGRFLVYYNNNNTIGLYPDNAVTPFSGSQTFAEGQWHFLTITMNKINGTQSTASIYVDGVLQASATNTYGTSGTAKLYVGSTGTPNNYFKGNLDDLTYYNYTRTLSQIKQDYANGLQQMAQQQGNLGNGLVGYWKMDEASWNGTAGEVIDSSGNGNNGQSFNSPSTSVGKFGQAGTFGATNNTYVKMTTNVPLASGQGRAFSFWIYPNSTENWAGVFIPYVPNSFGAILYYGTTGFISDRTCNNDTLFGATPTPNQWNQIIFTYDPISMNQRAYVNGVLKSTVSRASTGCGAFAANPMYIGNNGAGTSALDGKLDELRYYNRNITASEVQQLYNFGPPPIGGWNFEESSGGTFYDSSGNGLDEQAVGTTPRLKGKYGRGVLIRPSINRISTPSNTHIAPNMMTMEAWVKPNSMTTGDIAGYDNGAYNLQIRSDGSLWFRMRNSSASYLAALNSSPVFSSSDLGKWMHVAATYDGSTATLYYNGRVVATGSYSSFTPYGTGANYCFGYAALSYLDGSLDEEYLYNYARTPSQIIQDMNAGHPLGGSPVGSEALWLKMDEGSGTTVNNSGSAGLGFSGSLTNTTWTSGKFGRAVTMSGVSGNGIRVADTGNGVFPANNGAFTVSVWVNPTSLTTTTVKSILWDEINLTSGFRFGVLSNGKPCFWSTESGGSLTLTSNTTLSTGQWSQLIVTYDGSTGVMYLNGKQVATGTGTVLSNTSKIYIGPEIGGKDPWNGSIDEVKVYQAALTADQVKIDYNRNSSLVLGAVGTASDGKTPSNSSDRSYCPPGDTTGTCGPVGEWKFEEGYGTSVADTSGNGNNGTWGGTGSHWTSGKIGSAGQFNGSNDYVNAGTGSSLQIGTGAMTVSAWVKGNAPASGQTYLVDTKFCGSNGAGFYLAVNNTLIVATIANGSAQKSVTMSITPYTDGKWHNFQFVLQRGATDTLQIYGDGQLINTNTNTAGWDLTNGNEFDIGRGNCGGATYYTGSIDQVRLYNYARSAAQIAWDYDKGAPVAWYKLNECEGSTVHSSTIPYNPALNGTITIGSGGTQTAVGTCQTAGTAWGNGASGKWGASLNFDGTDDYVQTGRTTFTSTGYSIAGWFKLTNAGNNPQIIRDSSGLNNLYFINTDTHALRFDNFGSTNQCGTKSNLTTGIWYFFVVTSTMAQNDPSSRKIYINGVDDTGTCLGVTTNFTAHLDYIGYSFVGQIDDIQAYNYVLTTQQIKNLYNNSSAIYFGP